MDTAGRADSGNNTDQISKAIQELSKQLQMLQEVNREESETLRKYKDEGTLLELILVTGGLIRGKILWTGNQSFGVRTDSNQNVILYKHAIAFIQKQV